MPWTMHDGHAACYTALFCGGFHMVGMQPLHAHRHAPTHAHGRHAACRPCCMPWTCRMPPTRGYLGFMKVPLIRPLSTLKAVPSAETSPHAGSMAGCCRQRRRYRSRSRSRAQTSAHASARTNSPRIHVFLQPQVYAIRTLGRAHPRGHRHHKV